MQKILILGAGKSATVLIEFLLEQAERHDLFVSVADADRGLASAKVGNAGRGACLEIRPGDTGQIGELVSGADLVISMLPPSLHMHVAAACLNHGRHFLNASYLTDEIRALDKAARSSGLSFICEMGLDPGIDHMSAMDMIERIRKEGGRITAFRSHCGGLISPESDDNPWHYKISWNPRNIIRAGSDGAAYLRDGKEIHIPYPDLFDPGQLVDVPGHGTWSWYANRDSLSYIPVYGLDGLREFVRTTLRHPDFMLGWQLMVASKLTDERERYDTSGMTTRDYFIRHGLALDNLDPKRRDMFAYLGAGDAEPLPEGIHSSADILQWLLERKLALGDKDRDMIIMLHEIVFESAGKVRRHSAHLVVKGRDRNHTAMAMTVGLPLGIAALAILQGRIQRRGVSIPIYPEIYRILLPELERNGIAFTYTD